MSSIKIFRGNANIELAESVTKRLHASMGKAVVGRFSDGETMVEINESVRGKDVFIIQSTCAPTNQNLMELIIMADALRRASAASITAIMPYFGYARQDRRVRSKRVPITAKLVADMLAGSGVTRVITCDLHADQIQGFFTIPVDNIYASQDMLEDMKGKKYPSPMIVSPDVGGVVRARAIAKQMGGLELAIIDKRRAKANQSEVMHVIGDVQGRNCIIADDMVDTAGTLCHAAQALKDKGADTVTAYCTHPVLSGDAIKNIEASVLDEVVVTDTIPLRADAIACVKIRQISLSNLIAETIYRIIEKESVSSMFD